MKENIFIIVIVCFLFGACKNDMLDLPPETALSTPVFFKTQNDFQQAINGAYAPLRGLYNGNGGAWAMGEMRSDNTTYKYNPQDRGTTIPEFIADFNDDANSWVNTNKYFMNYDVIARCNQILEKIDLVEFDSSSKDNIKGQAYFLRAFAYFDLVQYYGEVPLHLKPAKSLEETALPLSSVDEVYQQIVADAEQAISLLPNKSVQELGRATSGAASMLLGNVYIVQKKWAEAESILKSVDGYSLMADYESVFNPANKNNSESLFEIQFKEGAEGFASNFFYTFLVQPITAEEITAVTGIPEVARTIEGFNIPTPDILAAYEDGDRRKEASIGLINAGGVDYPYIKKYSHEHTLTNNTNDNWPVYRYAELLLWNCNLN